MSSHVLELTTAIAPAQTFTVDEREYKLLGMEHLSKTEEAHVQALFSSYTQLAKRLQTAPTQVKAERVAAALYDLRMELLCSLTDLPRSVAEQLPLSGQVKLMNAIREATSLDEDDLEISGERDNEDEG